MPRHRLEELSQSWEIEIIQIVEMVRSVSSQEMLICIEDIYPSLVQISSECHDIPISSQCTVGIARIVLNIGWIALFQFDDAHVVIICYNLIETVARVRLIWEAIGWSRSPSRYISWFRVAM